MSDLPLNPIERKSITTREISPTTVTNARIATVTTTEITAATSKPKLSKFATLKSYNNAQDLIPLQHKETAYKATSSLQQSTIDIFAADIKKPTSPQHLEHLTRSKAVFERKRRRRCKNKRSCSLVNIKVADLKDENLETDDQEPMLRADVELFQGKIVFNLDGNAFIIATESSTQDSILNAKTVQKTTESNQLLASNVVGETNIATINLTTTTVASATTTTLSTPSTTLEEVPGGQDGQRLDALKCSASPRIHSFRIVSAQDATTANVANTTTADKSSVEKTEFRKLYTEQQQRSRYSTFDDNDSDSSNGHKISSKIQKSILMCFICKLSFGNTKSFSLHANIEHQLTLQAKEQHLLNREYSSVIIQPQNMDERPQISFLEPIDVLNVIQNDNLNSETDIQFNEGTSQVFSCRLDTSNSEKSTAGCVMREKSEKPATILSNSNSLSPSSSSTSPVSSVVPITQTALSPSKTVPNTLSSAIECINDSHLLLTTSFSKCMLQEQQYEENVPVPTTAVTTLLSSPKFDSSEQQQQKIKANVPIKSVDSADSEVQSASISPSLFPSTENMLAASTLLLPKKESENITKLDETYSLDTRTATGSVLCSNADVQLKPRLITSLIPTTKNTSMTCDMGNNDEHGLYSDDILSPPLSIFRKSHDKMLEMSTLAVNAPITQGDFEHFQEPSGTVSEEDNMLNSTDTLAATVTFLQQQQRQIATMASSSFDPPQPGLVTIAPTPTQLSCLQASLAALSDDIKVNCGTTDAHKTNAKLFTDFLQQHLNLQQQNTFSDISGNYSEHTDHNDGENCEIQQLKTPPYHISNHQFANNTSKFSPNRNNGSCTNSAIMKSPAHMTTSPTAVNVSTAAVAVTATIQQQHAATAAAVAAAAAAVSVANNTPSFTIGACSDHINGRPLGVECARCEMILNSTRLNTGVQMSTRNSCKTLKCPQCNWHYKYQETLEIHMREKHPDGESACGYCLSGQQHPRLARGESYSCGYKPYRCEICNYSTTTKGNLSIHMQSDKHLNNMQELNSSQSMLAAAVAAANSGKADVASKMLMSNNAAAAAQQQQQQQSLPQSQPQQPHSTLVASSSMISSGGPSVNAGGRTSVDGIGTNCSMLNKNKPSFRCDICSYETSVARNLRIHMTSEKHTHNLAALQNNIKHIQAYRFLQQHQQVMAAHQQQQLAAATQVPQSQLPALTSDAANSFLPEIALADLAYNQAIMIQFLQHNSVSQQQQHHESVAKMQIKTSPCSSPHSMQIEQQSTVHQQQQQLQQLRQHLQQCYSPNNSSSLLPSADPFSTSDVHFSSNVSGSCSNDETLEPPIHADPCPKSVYSCLVCGVYGTNSLDELNQHLLIDRSRSCKKQQSIPTNTVKSSCTEKAEKANVTNSNEVMVILNNNYICRLCNYKTNLKANFQLHSKTDKHLQKLNYINHVHEGGTQNEYKLKHLHLASNTVQLKCNCCDFYTNSIQKLSLHTQHMRHDTMRTIFQHLLHIMEQQNFERNKTEQMPAHSKTHSHKDAVEIVPSIRESHSDMPVHDNDGNHTNRSSSIVVEDTPQSMQKSLTCQLCGFSTFTLLNMIQHVKSMRHMQIEQFVNLQRRSEQLDPPSLDDVFKVAEYPTLQSLALTVAARQEENNMIENVNTTSVSVPMARSPNDDFGCITSSRDHNSFSPSSNSSTASGNTSVRSKSYNNVNIFNFQTTNDDKDASTSVLPGTSPLVMPSVVFKCNNCDFFAHSKTEMELHLSAVHPLTEPDYISIPTNSAAIEAFQAAVAAATAAASAVTTTRAPSNKSYSENDNFATIVKRERLCTPENEENVKSADVQIAMSVQDVSTVTPWLTSTTNTVSNNETSAAMVQPKSIHNVLRELEKTAEQEEQLIEDTSGVNALVESTKKISRESVNVQCPLCTDTFDSKQTLEMHLMNVHSVNRDGLSRLLQLVDISAWDLNGKTSVTFTVAKECKGSNIATETTTEQTITGNFNIKASTELDLSLMEVSNDTPLNLNVSHTSTYMHSMESLNNNKLSCQQCGLKFKHELQLLQHAQKMQHFIILPNGDHRCLAASHLSRPCQSTFPTQAAMVIHYKNTHTSLVISERHVYKYRCKHCSLAFKTQEKLSTHLLYHTMREATKCMLCQRNFRTTQALQKHIDQTHHSSGDQHVASKSPSTALSCSGRGSPALQMSHVQNKTQLNEVISDNAAKNQDINGKFRESPPMTPKANESPNVAPSPLPANILQDQQQQQHVAAFTAALLNQPLQQQQHMSGDELTESGGHLMQHLQLKPRNSLLTQKYLHQQNLQNLQQLPQLTAAASTSGLQLNPVEMFNLMQFHHIMSMNFMNLAPPLIFGVGTNSGSAGNVNLLTTTHTPKVTHNTSANALQCGNDMSVPCTSVSPRADLIGTLQQHPQSQSQQSAPTNTVQMGSNQKRARTRITDDQLKILRAHFDINNSPSEESIMEMSQKSNLPMKVVKHWFRNTLFKERQRNKDSPYNFNNPPSTTLNLEEYERTGHAKVIPLNEDLPTSSHNPMHQQQKQNMHVSNSKNNSKEKLTPMSDISGDSSLLIEIKTEPFDDNIEPHITTPGSPHRQNEQQQPQEQSQREQLKKDEKDLLSTSSTLLLSKRQQYLSALPATKHQQQLLEMPENTAVETAAVTPLEQHNHQQQHLSGQSNQNILQQHSQHINLYSYETKSESGSSDILSRPQSPNNSSTVVTTHYASINELINQQLDNLPLGQNNSNINAANMHGNNMGPPKNFQTSKSFDKNSPSSQFDTNSNSSNASSTSSGKRANRTRFTDYQIKVLQEFFENNSYPKDSDLEYLSKLLLLSPRVIVVWFQNARQKQRKIYENQPNNSLYETEEKKHNINYACKKCNMTFQRYYELIRHQKNHCFKEENNKKSAKAQIAAAQIAQNLSSEDSNSSMDINNSSAYQLHHQHISSAGATAALSSTANVSSTSPSSAAPDLTSPQLLFGKSSMSMTDFSPSTTPTPPQIQRERSDSSELLPQGPVHKSKFECDKCKLQFSYYEHFREHQLLHLMNPSLFTTQITNIPEAYGSFGNILQSLQQVAAASATHEHQFLEQPDQPPAKKRKCSETSSTTDEVPAICASGDGEISSSASFSKSKRYDFLYQYFMQNENNNELKQQFQAQHKKSHESEIEMEYLANFYHQSELRKRSNYDFLYQYYQKNEHIKQMSALPSQARFFGSENKPNIDVLLQYYQLNESKKFFQLNASNQQINDHPTASPISTSQYQHVNNPIPISTSDHTTTPRIDRYDITDMSSLKNSLDVLNSTINFPDYDNDNNDHETSSNGCGMDVDDAEIHTDTDDHINDNNQKSNENYGHKSQINVMKSSNDTDNKGYDQVANKLAGMDQINKLATNLQSPSSYGNDKHKPKNLSKSLARYVKNQKDNLAKCKANHVNQKSESKEKSKQQQHYSDLLQIQNETNGLGNNELTLQTMDKRHLPETPISSPNSTTNSNNKPTVGSSNTTANTVTGITEKQQSKRLRTTILPEQLNFLYECYQNDSNPSRKMLEEIAKKINLKKRVVQVWFQNSRAKDKKSRNQRFTAISDDSNYEDASQNNRDYGLFQKNALKSTKRHGSKDANFLPDANISNNTNTGMELGGCNLSQLSQVNIQQHALSIEHICKVKMLLEKTAVEVKLNTDSKIFSTAETDDNVEYGNKQIATDKPNTNADLKERKYVTSGESDFNSAQDSNFMAHMDTDIAGSDRLGTFTRIYKELKLQNAKKRAIGYTSNNQNTELMEWYERDNINNESQGLTTNDMSYNRCKGLQPQNTKQTSEENHKTPESYKIINLTYSAENIDNTDNKSSNGNKKCGQHVEAHDYKHYNNLNNIVSNKVMKMQYNINDSERSSSKTTFFSSNTPQVTSIADDEDTYIGENKDSCDGNTLDLNDNNETKQNASTRNERITANSSSTSCTLTTSTTHTQLTNAHEKDIIQQLFNCNQITDNSPRDVLE
ncbi:zinc finger protein 2 isoform X3 [Bactrocera dorsalis]|uniref:Zinc finger protein 2 isoform X3 n=2 Tax=Bactrocera dorsalis TaxID=27457 RepID=A0ABM3K380_BACDO|nr:zinc finger protein 2 isoform X3 [Bactrocera dorsalis]